MTAAVILAAGRSARMGRPKAFLPHFSPDSTFLSHLVGCAAEAGLNPILVVARPGDFELQREVVRLGGTLVENPGADRGQLSSLLAALPLVDAAFSDAIIVMPVDVPLITTNVLRRLAAAAERTDASILRASYRGQHGHPVLFKRSVFDELRAADIAHGARSVVRADPSRVLDVETEEPGVLVDVDTPDDYARAFLSRE